MRASSQIVKIILPAAILTIAALGLAWLVLAPRLNPARTAALSELVNEVNARLAAEAAWELATDGQVVRAGGGVRTGADARARVDISDGAILRVAANSEFELKELSGKASDPVTRLTLTAGKLWTAMVGALGSGTLEIETPAGTATVRGSFMSVEVTTAAEMVITCLEGQCRLTGASGKSTDLSDGQQAAIAGIGLDPSPAKPMDPAQYEDWAQNFPEAPAPEFTPPGDSIGVVTINPGEPIHIAYVLAFADALGIDSRNGVEIAIEDAGGKIADFSVKFDGEATDCSAEGGEAAGARLAADPTIVAVIGTSCSNEARVAMPLFSRAGFTVVSPSNTGPDLTEVGNPNNHPGYLRTAINDQVQGAIAARYAWEVLKVKSAATLHDGSPYADKLQAVFAEEFKKMGGAITAQEAVDPKQTDMSAALTRIAAGKPEMIYFPTPTVEAGALIIRQARETAGLENAILMGSDGLFSPDVMKGAGDAVEGFLVSGYVVSGPRYDEFLTKYKNKFGADPLSLFHAHAYDAFMMIKAAVEKVAVKGPDGTLYIPRQALRDAMYATTDFQGITGTLTCTPTGDCADPAGIGVYRYRAGQYPPEMVWQP